MKKKHKKNAQILQNQAHPIAGTIVAHSALNKTVTKNP
jgi:hypothetical protein